MLPQTNYFWFLVLSHHVFSYMKEKGGGGGGVRKLNCVYACFSKMKDKEVELENATNTLRLQSGN